MQAAFHGLPSSSREAASGAGRAIVVRKPRGAAAKEQGVAAVRAAPPQITCADILFALQDQPAGLTPALLARFVSQHGHESSSEASYVMV